MTRTRWVLSSWLLAAVWTVWAAPALPTAADLLVELLPAPVVDVQKPHFSWRIPAHREALVTGPVISGGYQVQVSADADFRRVVWDSGFVRSNSSAHVEYAGVALTSDSVYHWRVRWWANVTSSSGWASSTFTTALFQESDWAGAQFIRCENTTDCLYLRSQFKLPRWDPVVRASLHVGGLGWVEARLNGAKVAEEAVLEPGETEWKARVLYTTHDVTTMLGGPGSTNVIGVLLGNGWPGHLGHIVTGKLVLRATLRSGRVFTHATDPSHWRGSAGPITNNNIYLGETYDARLEIPGWDLPRGLDRHALRKWDRTRAAPDPFIVNTTMSLQTMYPIRKFQLLPALVTWEPAPGEWAVDFGQNTAGWTRLELDECEEGAQIVIRHAENLFPNGTIDQGNLRSAKATDVFICGGKGPVVYEPRFTYHGFRYIQVSGLSNPPGPKTLQARVVHSDVSLGGYTSDAAGRFVAGGGEGGEQLVNKIMAICEWTQRDNLHSVPTDCPQRDERQGWMADASVSNEGAMHYFWMPAFYANWLRTMSDTQAIGDREKDCTNRTVLRAGLASPGLTFDECVGAVADIAPHLSLFGHRPADPSWGIAYALVYENLVRYYGHRPVAEEFYHGIRAFADWNLRAADTDISGSGLVTYFYFGDWLQPGKVESDPLIARMSSSFNSLQAVRIARDAARFLGKADDAARYTARLFEKQRAFHRLYYDTSNGTYGDDSQAALTYALYIGAPPDRDVEARTLERLLDALKVRGMHVSTGIVSTKWLLEVLAAKGKAREALQLVLQKDFPSWGFMLANNATTVWEHWNALDNPSGDSMNSRNHPALSSVGAWMYRWIGGVRLGAYGHGYQDVVVGPAVVDEPTLTSCAVEVPSSYGPLRVKWSFDAASFTLVLQADLPPNTAGHVALPPALGRAPQSVEESGRTVWRAAGALAVSEGAWAAARGIVAADEGAREAMDGRPLLLLRVGSGRFDFAVRYGHHDHSNMQSAVFA